MKKLLNILLAFSILASCNPVLAQTVKCSQVYKRPIIICDGIYMTIDTTNYIATQYDLTQVTASATWGSITGTLSSQTDLQTALNAKQNTLSVTITGTGSIANTGTTSLTSFTGSGTTSGTNTGDQTSVSGNAGTATALQTPITINGVSFDGTANISVPAYTWTSWTTSFTPADSTSYYLGQYAGFVNTNSPLARKIFSPTACTIFAVYFTPYVTVAGSSNNSAIYIRVNNTTDYLITATCALNSSATLMNFNNTALSIPLAAGDYWEFKWVTPNWSSNPTGVLPSLLVYAK